MDQIKNFEIKMLIHQKNLLNKLEFYINIFTK